jgi:hypothetical protein
VELFRPCQVRQRAPAWSRRSDWDVGALLSSRLWRGAVVFFICTTVPRQLSIASLNAMNEDEISKAAVSCVTKLWPGIGIRELRSHCREMDQVWARWVFVHLLIREAALSRRIVIDLVNWRSGAMVVYALKALDCECAQNRKRAQQLADAVVLFRQLLQKRRAA